MNIGIDIDGTATRYPQFFMELGWAWLAAGHQVYLITGLGYSGLLERLDQWPFLRDTSWYTEIITTKDYNAEEKALIGKVDDNELIVGRFKQRICKERRVVVMFDDQAQKHRAFGNIPVFEVR